MRFRLALSCSGIVAWICFVVAGFPVACTSPDDTDGSGVALGTSSGGPPASGPSVGMATSTPSGGNAPPSGGGTPSTSSSPGEGHSSGAPPTSNPNTDPSASVPSTNNPPNDDTGAALPSSAASSSSNQENANGGNPNGSTSNAGIPNGPSANGGASNASASTPPGSGGGPHGDASGDPATPDAPEPYIFGHPPAAASYFKKGINLGNRMEAPNEGDWGGRVLDSDFPFIAARGFDHVRIPMRFSGHAQSSAPFTIDSSFFQRVDDVLDQATSAGLAVIIDLHSYDEMATEPLAERERFLALWSQIAERYADRPETVAFELLNEPNTQLDTVWNEIAAAAISIVRATNPRRLLIVDSVFWADPSKLSSLTLPNDANLLVSVHLYEPKLFSFQGKSWMGDPYMTAGVVFPGPPATPITPVQAALDEDWAASWFEAYNTLSAVDNPSGPTTVDAQIAYVVAYRAATGRTVYNGEWGPQDGADMTSRANLVRMVREKCQAEDIGWAIWEDPNNMKLFDSTAGTWVTPIIDALLP